MICVGLAHKFMLYSNVKGCKLVFVSPLVPLPTRNAPPLMQVCMLSHQPVCRPSAVARWHEVNYVPDSPYRVRLYNLGEEKQFLVARIK